ncbi:hypothetical protein BDQ17DRAFT_1244875, partial [Cyathus striatus]
IGLWDSANHDGFHFIFPPQVPQNDIFVFEVFAIVCAIHLLAQHSSPTRTVIIYSDSENTVALFNSLWAANAQYNSLLKIAVDELLHCQYQLRVLWIPGSENHIADALSCQRFAAARWYDSLLSHHILLPPQVVLGAISK